MTFVLLLVLSVQVPRGVALGSRGKPGRAVTGCWLLLLSLGAKLLLLLSCSISHDSSTIRLELLCAATICAAAVFRLHRVCCAVMSRSPDPTLYGNVRSIAI